MPQQERIKMFDVCKNDGLCVRFVFYSHDMALAVAETGSVSQLLGYVDNWRQPFECTALWIQIKCDGLHYVVTMNASYLKMVQGAMWMFPPLIEQWFRNMGLCYIFATFLADYFVLMQYIFLISYGHFHKKQLLHNATGWPQKICWCFHSFSVKVIRKCNSSVPSKAGIRNSTAVKDVL